MKKLLLPLLGLFVGLALGMLLVAAIGESPVKVMMVILKSAFGSRYDLGLTLYYTTPLIFTGLSVALAFHAGLFNVGAEGQLALGALAMSVFGHAFPDLPFPLAPILAVLAGMVVSALWAFIPAWLRVKRGGHEVIGTIMMNFVAAGIVSWLVSTRLQSTSTQNPETKMIAPAYFLRTWDPVAKMFGDAPVSIAIVFAILLALFLWVFLWRTPFGYEIRACGENPDAAKFAGIKVDRVRILAFMMAGSIAGLVGLSEVLGNAGRFRLGFSPDLGFVGIAVALMAKNNPIGILFSAFLFGALHKGAADLDIETEFVTRDISLVIQAFVILGVAVFSNAKWFSWRPRGRNS